MPPRQKTTFKKGQKKGTTTYKDYNPAQERANAQLERFIRDNPAGDKRNTEAPGIESILQDMPEKRAAFVKRNTRKDGTLNSAALAMLNPYLDERPEYARQMNRLRTSSPEMMQAYAKRFPVENFAMEVAPRFLPVVGPLFTADQGMKANRRKQEILNTPVNRPDGGFKNFVDFFAQGMTPEQRKNTEVISGESIRLAPQDIFNKSQPMTEKQKMDFMPGGPEIDIFDEEKAAIDEALPTGDIVYNPEDRLQSKIDFINQFYGTNFNKARFKNDEETLNKLFEETKRKQGLQIGETVDAGNAQEGDTEDPIPGGQFDLTNPAFSDQTNLVLSGDPEYDFSNFNTNTELGSLSENPNLFPEGGVSGTPVTQAGQELVFSDGTPVTEPVDTGLNTPAGQAAVDILNSNAVPATPSNNYTTLYQDLISGPNPTSGLMMQNPDLSYSDINDLAGGLSGGAYGGSPDFDYFADGGSTNKYENMSTHEKLMRMAAEMYG